MFTILLTFRHHKPIVFMMVVEIAIALALITNIIFFMNEHVDRVVLATGISDKNLATIRMTGVGGDAASPALVQADLAAIARVAGVRSVAEVNALPLSKLAWRAPIFTHVADAEPVLRHVSMYVGTTGFLKTMGVDVIAGRYFDADDYVNFNPLEGDSPPAVAVMTTTLASKIWPEGGAVGNVFYFGDKKHPVRLIGISAPVLSPDFHGSDDSSLNLFFPAHVIEGGTYIINGKPSQLGFIVDQATKALYSNDGNRVVLDSGPYARSVSAFFKSDRAAIRVLLSVIFCLVLLTALGVAALSSLWVTQRARQIGIRRALGARRVDIIRYFLGENLLVVLCGAMLGVLCALIMNHYFMQFFEVTRLPWEYVVFGVVLVALIGQLSALAPALLAAKIQPSSAIRK